jgi:hypothetical protein
MSGRHVYMKALSKAFTGSQKFAVPLKNGIVPGTNSLGITKSALSFQRHRLCTHVHCPLLSNERDIQIMHLELAPSWLTMKQLIETTH